MIYVRKNEFLKRILCELSIMDFECLKLLKAMKWFSNLKRIFLSIALCLQNEFQVYDFVNVLNVCFLPPSGSK